MTSDFVVLNKRKISYFINKVETFWLPATVEGVYQVPSRQFSRKNHWVYNTAATSDKNCQSLVAGWPSLPPSRYVYPYTYSEPTVFERIKGTPTYTLPLGDSPCVWCGGIGGTWKADVVWTSSPVCGHWAQCTSFLCTHPSRTWFTAALRNIINTTYWYKWNLVHSSLKWHHIKYNSMIQVEPGS